MLGLHGVWNCSEIVFQPQNAVVSRKHASKGEVNLCNVVGSYYGTGGRLIVMYIVCVCVGWGEGVV